MVPYYLYLSIRTRSLVFFSSVNPGIKSGGFYGDKKSEILRHLHPDYLPKTCLLTKDSSEEKIRNKLTINNLQYPIIAKPNVGERGTNVEKIEDEEALFRHAKKINNDFLVQEFLAFPIELGVFYSRLPSQQKGIVSSVTGKEFLSVTGNGKSTVEELVRAYPRAFFQLETLKKRFGTALNDVLAEGEKRVLEEIGNHCRGTKFINKNHLINDKLNEVFDKICLPFDGFYYGRFDLKVASIEDLYEGKNIKIMELNGTNADPAHFYDPDYKLLTAYKDLRWHWKRLADIHLENKKRGIAPLSAKEIIVILKNHFFEQ
jgi:hypothetical protein